MTDSLEISKKLFSDLEKLHSMCRYLRLGWAQKIDSKVLAEEFERVLSLLRGEHRQFDPEEKLLKVTEALSLCVANGECQTNLQRFYDLYVVFDCFIGEIFAALEMADMEQGKQKTRIDLIGSLIRNNGYSRYLEIGTRDDECFNAIDVPYKVGVDPASGGTLRMTSDQYFSEHEDNFDIIFVDGLHEAVQVYRDIENSLRVLNNGGVIVMHDCNPLYESRQFVPPIVRSWNGDTWRAFVHYRGREDLDLVVGDFDQGCGVLKVRNNPSPITLEKPYHDLRWEDLEENREKWINKKSFEEVLEWS